MDLCTSGLACWQALPATISERFGTEIEISRVVSESFSASSVSLTLSPMSTSTRLSSSPLMSAFCLRNNFLMTRCCSMMV